MELRHLRYFLAVAEELHFGRAALRLNMAQPPLSQQIMVLEGELGVRLFERTRRRVELTAAGQAFLPEARATLAQAQRAEAAVRESALGTRGRLAIGFVTSASHTLLPTVVRAFRAAYPAVDLSLQEMNPAEQLEALERREIDVGFLRPPVDCPGMESEVVLTEPLVIALPAAHPLTKQATLTLRQIKEEPFILFPRKHGPGIYDVIMTACRHAGYTPTPKHEADSMQSMLAHVASGLGVALIPASLMTQHLEEIAYRPIRGAKANVSIAVTWSTRHLSAVIRHFLDIARATGKSCLHLPPKPRLAQAQKTRGIRRQVPAA